MDAYEALGKSSEIPYSHTWAHDVANVLKPLDDLEGTLRKTVFDALAGEDIRPWQTELLRLARGMTMEDAAEDTFRRFISIYTPEVTRCLSGVDIGAEARTHPILQSQVGASLLETWAGLGQTDVESLFALAYQKIAPYRTDDDIWSELVILALMNAESTDDVDELVQNFPSARTLDTVERLALYFAETLECNRTEDPIPCPPLDAILSRLIAHRHGLDLSHRTTFGDAWPSKAPLDTLTDGDDDEVRQLVLERLWWTEEQADPVLRMGQLAAKSDAAYLRLGARRQWLAHVRRSGDIQAPMDCSPRVNWEWADEENERFEHRRKVALQALRLSETASMEEVKGALGESGPEDWVGLMEILREALPDKARQEERKAFRVIIDSQDGPTLEQAFRSSPKALAHWKSLREILTLDTPPDGPLPAGFEAEILTFERLAQVAQEAQTRLPAWKLTTEAIGIAGPQVSEAYLESQSRLHAAAEYGLRLFTRLPNDEFHASNRVLWKVADLFLLLDGGQNHAEQYFRIVRDSFYGEFPCTRLTLSLDIARACLAQAGTDPLACSRAEVELMDIVSEPGAESFTSAYASANQLMARLLSNEGGILRNQQAGRLKPNLPMAIGAQQTAIQAIRNAYGLQFDLLLEPTLRLADMLVEAGEWEAGLVAYTQGHFFRTNVSTRQEHRPEAWEAHRDETVLYARCGLGMAYCAARLGSAEAAISSLESARNRMIALSEGLAGERPEEVPQEVWNEFKAAQGSMEGLPSPWQGKRGTTQSQLDAHERLVEESIARFEAAIGAVRDSAPSFDEGSHEAALAELLSDGRTAVAWLQPYADSTLLLVDDGVRRSARFLPYREKDWRRFAIGSDTKAGWLEIAGGSDLEVMRADAMQTIGKNIVGPLANLVGDRDRLVLIPGGLLRILPIASTPLDNDWSEILSDRYLIVTSPSVRHAARGQRRRDPASNSLFAAYDASPAGPRLARLECARIGRKFPSATVATETRSHNGWLGDVVGATHIHFSAHASFDFADPMSSKIKIGDEPLSLSSLVEAGARLTGCRVVTLSACQSGLVDYLGGLADEEMGFVGGFLLGGVGAVVAALWPVRELETLLLLDEMYRALDEGMSTPAALQKAQRWLRRLSKEDAQKRIAELYEIAEADEAATLDGDIEQLRGDYPFNSPGKWAAFVAFGG